MVVVEAVRLGKRFGSLAALADLDLELRAGESLTIFGPNGAGKTTLVKLLATVLQPSSGQLRLFGEERAKPPLRRRIGLVSHGSFLYGELTAAENLRFFARVYNLDAVERRVDAALERAGLSARRDDIVSGFSRGMRQRLALERALIHEPRLLLLDEPFTGLDEAAREALRVRLRLAREAGAIAILTTHDTAAIEHLTDAAVTLVDGRLAA